MVMYEVINIIRELFLLFYKVFFDQTHELIP